MPAVPSALSYINGPGPRSIIVRNMDRDHPPTQPSETDEAAATLVRTVTARRLIEDYATDLRELVKKLRKLLN
jgi:hypothetical protein